MTDTASNKKSAARKKVDFSVGPGDSGYKLIWALLHKATDDGLNQLKLADKIGLSAGTLGHLCTGRRSPKALKRASIDLIAEYLNIPALSVMMMAEIVKPQDFYEDTSDVQRSIESAIHYILHDPDWGVWVPRKLLQSKDTDMQIYTIWCYEKATGTKLLRGGVNYNKMIDSITEFREEYPEQQENTN